MFITHNMIPSLQGRAGFNLLIRTNRLMGGGAGNTLVKSREQGTKPRIASARWEEREDHISCSMICTEVCGSPHPYLCESR